MVTFDSMIYKSLEDNIKLKSDFWIIEQQTVLLWNLTRSINAVRLENIWSEIKLISLCDNISLSPESSVWFQLITADQSNILLKKNYGEVFLKLLLHQNK